MHPLLAGYPILVRVPVAWAEMDVFRHVNNTVFFRWFETARIAYLERIGFDDEMKQNGIGPILASTHARFRKPVFYPDTVMVGARATEVGEDRFTMEYAVVSGEQDALAAEGGGIVVSYDYRSRRKAPLPPNVVAEIRSLEGRAGR